MDRTAPTDQAARSWTGPPFPDYRSFVRQRDIGRPLGSAFLLPAATASVPPVRSPASRGGSQPPARIVTGMIGHVVGGQPAYRGMLRALVNSGYVVQPLPQPVRRGAVRQACEASSTAAALLLCFRDGDLDQLRSWAAEARHSDAPVTELLVVSPTLPRTMAASCGLTLCRAWADVGNYLPIMRNA